MSSNSEWRQLAPQEKYHLQQFLRGERGLYSAERFVKKYKLTVSAEEWQNAELGDEAAMPRVFESLGYYTPEEGLNEDIRPVPDPKYVQHVIGLLVRYYREKTKLSREEYIDQNNLREMRITPDTLNSIETEGRYIDRIFPFLGFNDEADAYDKALAMGIDNRRYAIQPVEVPAVLRAKITAVVKENLIKEKGWKQRGSRLTAPTADSRDFDPELTPELRRKIGLVTARNQCYSNAVLEEVAVYAGYSSASELMRIAAQRKNDAGYSPGGPGS